MIVCGRFLLTDYLSNYLSDYLSDYLSEIRSRVTGLLVWKRFRYALKDEIDFFHERVNEILLLYLNEGREPFLLEATKNSIGTTCYAICLFAVIFCSNRSTGQTQCLIRMCDTSLLFVLASVTRFSIFNIHPEKLPIRSKSATLRI